MATADLSPSSDQADTLIVGKKKARKWKSEIELAGKREKPWRDTAKKIIDKYKGANPKKNGFNILWANTEILRPAIYNSTPKPDVRRRFRDSDPVGKAVAEILERSLYVIIDHYSTDTSFKLDALDACLAGRGVSRIRYLAKIDKVPHQIGGGDDNESDGDDDSDEPQYDERLTYEQVCIEHVNWEDFRHGFGRSWDEVTWVAFRHKLMEEEAEDKFGADAIDEVKFTAPEIEDEKKRDTATEVEKQAEFWEVWDKSSRTVFFTQADIQSVLYPLDTPNGEPPLDFHGFFPCAEPLKLIETSDTLVPVPIYTLYEQQANELDEISRRIIKIVNALKLRGVYDATLGELADVMAADDNDLVPIAKAAMWRDNGGIEKAISWVPIGPASQVLEALNAARESAKSVIYEITGISDIIRGASVASETATAQQIKANYAGARLKKMQAAVQTYTRDTLRLASEVIAEKFEQQTLAQMTGLQFPTAEQQQQVQGQIQQAQQQYQMVALQAQQQGQQPPPPPQPPGDDIKTMLSMPNWESLIQILRNDAIRDFKVDVETDSTVAASIESDMQSLSQVVTALGQTMSVFAPLIQEGALPLDAGKQIILAVCRRAKLGLAVEDAIEKMQQPPPKQPDPPPPDSSPQVAQIKAQSDQALTQVKEQSENQRRQMELQFTDQAKQREQAIEAQLNAAKRDHELQMEQVRTNAENLRTATQLETQRQIADANNATQLRIAQMAQDHAASLQSQKLQSDQAVASIKAESEQKLAQLTTVAQASTDRAPEAADYKAVESDSHIAAIKELVTAVTKPKRIVRDSAGNITGLE